MAISVGKTNRVEKDIKKCKKIFEKKKLKMKMKVVIFNRKNRKNVSKKEKLKIQIFNTNMRLKGCEDRL